MADEPAPAAPELSPAVQALAEQGFAIGEGWPVNHRLRAEALVAAGQTEDPAGYLTADDIAETAARLEGEKADAEAAARAAAAETPSETWSKPDLVAAAEARQLDTSGTKAELVKRLTESAPSTPAADAANEG